MYLYGAKMFLMYIQRYIIDIIKTCYHKVNIVFEDFLGKNSAFNITDIYAHAVYIIT